MTEDFNLLSPLIKEKILHRIGQEIVAKAKRLAPIDTGALRSKITYKVDGNRITISTEGIEYAEFLEYGTSKISIGTPEDPRRLPNGTYLPFIRTAIYQTSIPRIVKQVLKEENGNST